MTPLVRRSIAVPLAALRSMGLLVTSSKWRQPHVVIDAQGIALWTSIDGRARRLDLARV